MWTVICDKDDGIRVVDPSRLGYANSWESLYGTNRSDESIVILTKPHSKRAERVYLPRGIDSIDDLPLFGTLRGATPFLVDYYSN